jgi:two-component system, OmpR family, phosphate regulon response regulator OmpR
MATISILLIDDDLEFAEHLRAYLATQGTNLVHEGNPLRGIERVQNAPDQWLAVVVDGMMPELDGLDVCRRIRALPQPGRDLPILMLSARSHQEARVDGLEAGADDYLGKPFFGPELLARIRAVLRRRPGGGEGIAENASASVPEAEAKHADGPLSVGSLHLDPNGWSARVDDRVLDLTPFEFRLLYALATRAGKAWTRKDLAKELTPEVPYDPAVDRSIDVHVSRIRQKIEDVGSSAGFLRTVRGVGYVILRSS